jgi:hypothetical protein
MTDLGGAGWRPHIAISEPRGLGRPAVVGTVVVLVAIAAWHGLFWALRPPTAAGTRPVPVALAPLPRPDEVFPAPSAPPTPPAPSTSSTTPKSAAAAAGDSARVSGRDSSSRPGHALHLSPFLLSHPWAAPTGGRFYYPTDCPATLQLVDLLFFKTEDAALAKGFVRAPDSGCRSVSRSASDTSR